MRRRRALQTLACAAFAAFWMVLFWGGCGEESAGPEGLCNPGENIFCRCPGGAPGTKLCENSGQSFAACEPCEPRPSAGPGGLGGPGAGGPGAGGPGAGGTGGNGGAGGAGGMGDGPLLSACMEGSDCQSGMCEDSFCTINCSKVSDCPYPESECIPYKGKTICMPACVTAGDCAPFNAPPSACGFTKAVDNWGVTVCADWADDHELMPLFTDCLPFQHEACNLGYQQRELVCNEQGVCVEGCFVNNDCPANTTCNGGGGFGQCI